MRQGKGKTGTYCRDDWKDAKQVHDSQWTQSISFLSLKNSRRADGTKCHLPGRMCTKTLVPSAISVLNSRATLSVDPVGFQALALLTIVIVLDFLYV